MSDYHEWSQAEIAEQAQVSVRTVRWWQSSAVEQLQQAGLSEPEQLLTWADFAGISRRPHYSDTTRGSRETGRTAP